MLTRLSACLILSLSLAAFAIAAEPTVKKEDLPRVPPTEPKDALKTFTVRPGFHLELAASEPNVVDPVAMCFDENGRMFVVEMIDYSERRAEKLGRIRMLEDRDGDGIYEKSTIFLDHLPWPTALFWCNGGLLVGACPDIIFAKDTNGDGVADETKVLFTGFGADEKLNVQGLFNNFQWGLDNRIHGCSGHDGGMVKQLLHPEAPPLDVRGKGFVIDPRDWSMTTEAGGGQYGLSFDPTGRLFTCTNSSHCEVFMYDAKYAARNPYVTLPDPRISIADDGPAAEVYRISPEEPWRVIRTRWRVAGLVGGPVEGGGRSAGYFTGATGITIYKGDAFGPDYVGDAFVGDAGGNLVHHKRIHPGPDGIEPIASRPDDEKKIEFVASTDNWFRPVDFANAPDGCLYICDMYREIIEHPWSIPPQIKQFLDLNSGNDRGRIYRLAPDGWKPRAQPKLGSASTPELVAALESPNGWTRETASRLLFERQDKSAKSALFELLGPTESPSTQLQALHVLNGLECADETVVGWAMRSHHSPVRAHAIALSEQLLSHGVPSEFLWHDLWLATHDDDPLVRFQLAFTLGQVKHQDKAKALTTLAWENAQSRWMQAAIISSVGDDAPDLLFALEHDYAAHPSKARMDFIAQIAELIGARRLWSAQQLFQQFLWNKDVLSRFTITLAVLRGAEQGGHPYPRPAVSHAGSPADMEADAMDRLLFMADTFAQGDKKTADLRPITLAILRFGNLERSRETLAEALSDRLESVQVASLTTLDHFDDPGVAELILKHLAPLPPRVKSEAIAVLLKRPTRAVELLKTIQAGSLKQTDLDASHINQLLSSKDDDVRTLARKVLAAPAKDRSAVVEAFRPALTLKGDPAKGKLLYEQRCISCHRAAGEGNAVGPDLVTVKNSGGEKLLLSILDPSREVAPNYINYLIETKDGQSVLGILASDTPAAIVVRQAYAKETVIQRDQIRRMSSQGKSLMPEGLEAGLKPQDLADVIAFIESVK